MDKRKTGVVFEENDYAGFMTRIIIIVIDLAFVYLIFLAGNYADDFLYRNYNYYSPVIYVHMPVLISYLYLTVLKASKHGTFGQRITNTKILHITGKKPNVFIMTYRLLFWIAGPFNFLFDLAWITLNKEKRTLRDSICNTILVKKNAIPVSSDAQIRNVRAMVFGFHFLYDTAKP